MERDKRILHVLENGGRNIRFPERGVERAVDPALWLLPPAGAFIGWITNVIAIRMLFYPRQPVRIPLTPFRLQGVLPKRQAELAASIGRTVARDLVSVPDLLGRLELDALKAQLAATVGVHVERRVEQGLSRWLPGRWRASVAAYMKDLVVREAGGVLDGVVEEFGRRAGERLDVERLVTDKVMQLPLDELENLILRLAGKELRAVIMLGGVFGFLIGLLQMLAMAVLGAGH